MKGGSMCLKVASQHKRERKSAKKHNTNVRYSNSSSNSELLNLERKKKNGNHPEYDVSETDFYISPYSVTDRTCFRFQSAEASYVYVCVCGVFFFGSLVIFSSFNIHSKMYYNLTFFEYLGRLSGGDMSWTIVQRRELYGLIRKAGKKEKRRGREAEREKIVQLKTWIN